MIWRQIVSQFEKGLKYISQQLHVTTYNLSVFFVKLVLCKLKSNSLVTLWKHLLILLKYANIVIRNHLKKNIFFLSFISVSTKELVVQAISS